MKKNILKYLFFFFFTNFKAQQNLVINGSFEEKVNCPTGAGEIHQATGWNTFRESPDYFNSCAPISSYYSVPNNGFGYQVAANGNAYAGIICYNNTILSREIIADSLMTPLAVGQKYFVSFKIIKPKVTSIVGYSINGIGVKLSTVTQNSMNIDNLPMIYTNSIVSDTVNWTRISSSFIADSAYQYLMIGNFFDDANTSIVNNGTGPYAYYLVDDVCLSTDSLLCTNFSTSIYKNNLFNQFTLYPNPANNLVVIQNNTNSVFDIAIYNTIGQLIYTKQKVNSNDHKLDISQHNNGLLFVRITNLNNQFIYKILKQ